MTRPRRLAVRCSDGCGFTGRRDVDQDERPCPRCGEPVDVGWPSKPAFQTKRGTVGARTVLTWGPWPGSMRR